MKEAKSKDLGFKNWLIRQFVSCSSLVENE